MEEHVVKQGNIYFLESKDADQLVKCVGEHIPKKCRPFIVVSNNVNNKCSEFIHVCPVYTRKQAKLPTQFYYFNGRDQVACVENIIMVNRNLTTYNNFAGTIPKNKFEELYKCCCVHFGGLENPNKISQNPITNINELTEQILDSIKPILIEEINSCITSAFSELLKSKFTIQINSNDMHKDEKSLKNVECKPVIKVPKEIKNSKKGTKYSKNKRFLPEMFKEYHMDYEKLSISELIEKYSEYGVTDSLTASKKAWYVKNKLKSLGEEINSTRRRKYEKKSS